MFWGYDEKQDADIRAGFDVCVKSGVKLIDTAEIYGPGRSEELLGKFIKESGADVMVATKFAPLPWKLSRSDVVSACKDSLKRLGLESLDLYQLHFPAAWKNEAFWDGLGDCYEQGLVRAVGVSNYGSAAVRAVNRTLAARGIPLTSNQVQYSLLYRYPELNGLADTCGELGVRILAYSPLALGALTGKYDPATGGSLPSGPRRLIAEELLKDGSYAELVALMREIAAKRGGAATPSQVALAWCMAKGTTPIPGVRNARQASDNVGALSLELDAREVTDLDTVSSRVKPVLTPERSPMVKISADTKMAMMDS